MSNVTATKNLKAWWRQFTAKNAPVKKSADGKGKGVRAIFGVELADAIEYASIPICMAGPDGRQYVYGYIPTIVAKCGMFLKQEATTTEGIFRLSGSAKRIKELQAIFDSPPSYGKTLTWVGYSVHDAANILRRYLNHLPDPVIPQKRYEEFRSVLDLLAVFSSKSEQNLMPSKNLASIFQPGILSHESHDMAPEQYKLSSQPPNLNNPTPVRRNTRRSSFSLERNEKGEFEPASPDSPRHQSNTTTDNNNDSDNNNSSVSRTSTLGRSKTLPSNMKKRPKIRHQGSGEGENVTSPTTNYSNSANRKNSRNLKSPQMNPQLSSGSLMSTNTIRSGSSRATQQQRRLRHHPKSSSTIRFGSDEAFSRPHPKRSNSSNSVPLHPALRASSSMMIKCHSTTESIHTSPSTSNIDDHKENEIISSSTNPKRRRADNNKPKIIADNPHPSTISDNNNKKQIKKKKRNNGITNDINTNVSNVNPVNLLSSSPTKGKEKTQFFVGLRKKIGLGASNSGYSDGCGEEKQKS
ncbi:14565_t:CDS:2 [Ambispora leptoticha]|uniref:14565_t:CDS:1 n=1 Tax=Ambispora leptoticha TaxID=144679 RepID=A0A9N9CR49_9GLOM|nr:14565_t:CDS:2 [Ambispora leptoticha]